MRFLAVILLTLVCESALSQTITGTDESPEHRLIRLELDGLDDGDSAVWDAFSLTGVEPDGIAIEGGRAFVFTGPPGRYRVSATYLKDGALGQDRKYVTVGGVPPGPVPVPPPPPDLTGAAKAAYDSAPRGRGDEPQTVAGIYRGVASAGAAVSTMTPDEMAAKLGADMKSRMTDEQRSAWKTFGAAVGQYLDRSRSRDATIATLNEIADGLEAVQ